MRTLISFTIVTLLLVFGCTAPKSNNADTQSDALQTSEEIKHPDQSGYIVAVGDMAPDFILQTNQGESVRLSDLRGKVVMLQFTASWCGVCREEMPFIERDIWKKWKKNSNFALYAIDREENAQSVDSLVSQTGITYPVAYDTTGDVFASYAVRNAGITRNVIVGRDGRIVQLTRLFNKEEFDAMVVTIDSLLNIK